MKSYSDQSPVTIEEINKIAFKLKLLITLNIVNLFALGIIIISL